MGMDNLKDKNDRGQKHMRTAWIPIQAGCLTLTLAAVAILVGLWLDTQLDTTPQWMLILLIASAPFAFFGVILLTRRALRKLQDEMKMDKNDEET